MKRIYASDLSPGELFGELHDAGDFERSSKIYDQIYDILDQYGTDDDPVNIIFDRASASDQTKLMRLAKQAARESNGREVREIRTAIVDLYHVLMKYSDIAEAILDDPSFIDSLEAEYRYISR